MSRTAVFFIDGERFVFQGSEIDDLLERVSDEAETPNEAWELTAAVGESDNGP